MSMQIADTSETTITVAVPLTVRARSGRPKMVLLPAEANEPPSSPEPKLLRAIARAWLWRRRLEAGEVSTVDEIARDEGVTRPYISRMMRLAYLAPGVLEHLISGDSASELPIEKLAKVAERPWAVQAAELLNT